MKKFLIIGIFLMFAFSMTGCPEEKVEVIPEILLDSNKLELEVGDSIDLASNLKSATLDGADVAGDVVIEHNIPLSGDQISEMGAYYVNYFLTVEDKKYSETCVVVVTEAYEVDYDVLVSKRSFASVDGDGKFYLTVGYTGLSSTDKDSLTVEFNCADYPEATVESIDVTDEQLVSVVIDLKDDWLDTKNSYTISVKSDGKTVYSHNMLVTLDPTIELVKGTANVNINTTLALEEFISTALYDNGSDASNDVAIEVFDKDNNVIADVDTTAVAKYTVIYTLNERGTEVSTSMVLNIIDPDALVKVLSVPEAIFAEDITLDTPQIVNIDFTTYGSELIAYINELTQSDLEQVRFVVQYKYTFYANYQDDNGNWIKDENSFYTISVDPSNNSYTAILAAINVEKAARNYMFENVFDSIKITGDVTITISTRNNYKDTTAKLEASDPCEITGEWIISVLSDEIVLPTTGKITYKNINNGNFLQFDLANVSQIVRNGFNVSYDDLEGQVVYQYKIIDNVTKEVIYTENRPINEVTKDTTTATAAYIQTNTVKTELDKYMDDKSVDYVDFTVTVQVVTTEDFSLDFDVTLGGITEVYNIYGTPQQYTNSMTFNENRGYGAWAELDPGQQSVWFDGAATMTATNSINEDGNTVTTIIGNQAVGSGNWYQNQYFISSLPVPYTGTYTDIYTITINVSGMVQINLYNDGKSKNVNYEVEAGVPLVIKTTNTFTKGTTPWFRMVFATSSTGTIGNYIATIEGAKFTPSTPKTLTVKNDTVNLESGIKTDDVQEALVNNIEFALDDSGLDISSKVVFLTDIELILDENGNVAAGTYKVVYSVTMNGIKITAEVTLIIV